MAQTRGATGHSKPRVFTPVSTEPTRKRATGGTTTKRAAPKPKTGAGVTKTTKRAPATQTKKKSSVKAKVEGVADKVAGTLERKPGKKAAGTKKIKGTEGKSAKATVV